MKNMIVCDADPNNPIDVLASICLMKHVSTIQMDKRDKQTGKPGKHYPCLKCPTGLKLKEEQKPMQTQIAESIKVPQPPEASHVKGKTAPEAESEKTTKNCLRCKEDKIIVSRGLCRGCYDKSREDGTRDKYPAIIATHQKKAKKIGLACKACGKGTKNRETGGLCHKCYHKKTEKKTSQPPAPQNTVYFPPMVKEEPVEIPDSADLRKTYPEIFAYVAARAKREMRPLPLQLLWILKESMDENKSLME